MEEASINGCVCNGIFEILMCFREQKCESVREANRNATPVTNRSLGIVHCLAQCNNIQNRHLGLLGYLLGKNLYIIHLCRLHCWTWKSQLRVQMMRCCYITGSDTPVYYYSVVSSYCCWCRLVSWFGISNTHYLGDSKIIQHNL